VTEPAPPAVYNPPETNVYRQVVDLPDGGQSTATPHFANKPSISREAAVVNPPAAVGQPAVGTASGDAKAEPSQPPKTVRTGSFAWLLSLCNH